jgi:ABC-2 type transport system permease protein
MPDRRGLEMRDYFEFWEHKLIQIVWALFGLLLRFTSLSWAALGAFVLLGELLQVDQWMLDLSPFTHIPKLPGGEISAEPAMKKYS